jgi:hypothetical protein
LSSPLAAPCILQWLWTHGDVLGRVRHAGVPHELLEPPGIHAAVGLHRAGSMPQAVRMDRKVNIRIASGSLDHFIDGKSTPVEDRPMFEDWQSRTVCKPMTDPFTRSHRRASAVILEHVVQAVINSSTNRFSSRCAGRWVDHHYLSVEELKLSRQRNPLAAANSRAWALIWFIAYPG